MTEGDGRRQGNGKTSTTAFIVGVGVVLPYTSLAPLLGFVPLPPADVAFLGGATLTYLGLVEGVKRRLLRRLVA